MPRSYEDIMEISQQLNKNKNRTSCSKKLSNLFYCIIETIEETLFDIRIFIMNYF